jgi:WD40 repeat protein
VQQIGESQGDAASLAFSGDGRLLASASLDGVVRLWQVADGQLIRELPRQEKAALGVAFSPDGALLATVGADRLVRLWQVESGEQVRVMAGHADARPVGGVQSRRHPPGFWRAGRRD